MTDIELVIADVERYYVAGHNSRREYPNRLPYASGLTTSQKQKLSLQRRFADPEWGYTPEALRQLIAAFRRSEPPFALTPSAIGTIMGVPPGPKREKLVADAIKHGWAQARVAREIKLQKLTEPMQGRGRTFKPPKDLQEMLAMIEAEYCPHWLRLLESIQGNSSVKLPVALAVKVRTAEAAISDLLATTKRLRVGKS